MSHAHRSGILNTLINRTPIELHLPGYQFCGPGTKLKKRLKRGDQGINPLDAACKEHDIAYSESRDIRKRNLADDILAEKAASRIGASDSSFSEKLNATAVHGIMKVKSKLGMGLEKKKKKPELPFSKIVAAARKRMNKETKDGMVAIRTALAGARKAVREGGGKSRVKKFRTLPIPAIEGGALPLIPIFAGLSALGALANGASGIIKAINDAKSMKNQLKEVNRHNEVMENIAMGKGLYLRPYSSGSGLKLRIVNDDNAAKKKHNSAKKKKKFLLKL